MIANIENRSSPAMRLDYICSTLLIERETHRILDQRFRGKNLGPKVWGQTQLLQGKVQFGGIRGQWSRFRSLYSDQCTKE
jgi:hypothetical protein